MNQSNTHPEQTLRGKLGWALNTQKTWIAASILFVFIVNRIGLFFPDLNLFGIPLALLAIWLVSWLKRAGWSDLGLFRPQSWPKIILFGLATGAVLQAIALIQIKLGGPMPDISAFEQVKNNPWALLGFLVISWTTAGFGEEVIWRGFYMKQIARLFDEQKTGWVIGLVLSSVVFGLVHYYQGVNGIVITGIGGLVNGLLYFKFGKNLWASIFAHGIADTIAFVLIYNWDAVSRILGI